MKNEELQDDIRMIIRMWLPCFECEQNKEHFYLVREEDIEKVVMALNNYLS